jgi:hypothetical protein
MVPRALDERRAPRVRSGFGTSCLQSEMILSHMLVQPCSYSPWHMFMHSRKSQLASIARAEDAVMKRAIARTKRRT